VPAVQVADLLPELPDVEPNVSGQTGPVDVAFFDAHFLLLEREEDLGLGVGIEIGLKRELELPGHRVVPLGALVLDIQPDIARRADLGIEQVLPPRT
jgi:hypothetical protein